MDQMICNFDKSYSLSQNRFVREGYTFLGWNSKADGSGKNYEEGAVIRNLGTSGQILKLYALWKPDFVSLKQADVMINPMRFVYDGNEKIPEISVSVNGAVLDYGIDYDSSYTNMVNAGTAYCLIKGKGSYGESKQVSYTIEPADISDSSVSEIGIQKMTGKAVCPEPSVSLNGRILDKDTDYSLAYQNNRKIGTATVIITGKNNYKGSCKTTFKILEDQKMSVKVNSSKLVKGNTVALTVSGAKGKLSFLSSNSGIVSVSSKGMVKANEVGNAVITIHAAAKGNYSESDKEVSFTVVPSAPSSLKSQIINKNIRLTWSHVERAAGYYIYRNNKKIATVNGEYSLDYTDMIGKLNGTKYLFKVAAFAETGKGADSKTITVFSISNPAFSKISNVKGRKISASWTKSSGSTGYELQYSQTNIFGLGSKTILINKSESVSKTISGLTKGKTYSIRVRAYKKNGGSKYVSSWSEIRRVKIIK